VEIGGDSKLVLNQLLGEWQVSCQALKADHGECEAYLSSFMAVKVYHLRRRLNTAADTLANKAADGETKQEYATPPNRSGEPQAASPLTSPTPDIATCLLGVKPHRTVAVVDKGVDWFQVMRLSTLRHLYRTRNEAWAKDHHATPASIRACITSDLVKCILLEAAHCNTPDPFPRDLVLKGTVAYKEASSRDFKDIAGW
jgi:hypothetical protein